MNFAKFLVSEEICISNRLIRVYNKMINPLFIRCFLPFTGLIMFCNKYIFAFTNVVPYGRDFRPEA